MTNKRVTVTLRIDDAEPFLRKAAFEAAKFGALCDYMTKRTANCVERGFGESFDDARARWSERFRAAKRIVETFGVEYEQTSEQETLTVGYPLEGGKVKRVGGFDFVEGSKLNYNKPHPEYRREVHTHACYAAADRVVRKWRESVT